MRLSSEIKRIIVLGGGTAGWITAGLLAKKHAGGVKVTLIESPGETAAMELATLVPYEE